MQLDNETKHQIAELLAKPSRVGAEHASLLASLIKAYPFYQTLHLLYAKATTEDVNSSQNLAKASFYNNGAILHQVIFQPETLTKLMDVNLVNYEPLEKTIIAATDEDHELKMGPVSIASEKVDVEEVQEQSIPDTDEQKLQTNEEAQLTEETAVDETPEASVAEITPPIDYPKHDVFEEIGEIDPTAFQNNVHEEKQRIENTIGEKIFDDEISAPEQNDEQEVSTPVEVEPEEVNPTHFEIETAEQAIVEIDEEGPEVNEQNTIFKNSHNKADVANYDFVEVENLPLSEIPSFETPIAEDEPETPSEIENTEVSVTEPQTEEPIFESIASTDFFAFEKATEAVNEPTEEASETLTEEPARQTEEHIISKYDDDQLPFTFLWWLTKTRAEHAQIFQPYVTAKKQVASADLQQQYVEHIFHLQAPYNLTDSDTETEDADLKDALSGKSDEIIENFIKSDPQIRALKSEQIDNENKAKKSAEDHYDLVSETLASIYIEQMLYHKAIDTYEKLSLKFPEKSRYFADLIQSLEKKI